MRKNFGAKTWLYPMPVLIIGTYDEDGTPDAMNAAWGGIYDTNQIMICIDGGHKTAENIRKTGAFTVSFGTAKTVISCDYVGIVSANDVPDKLARAGFHATRSERINAPIIDELPMTVECRLIKFNEDGVCIGEIVNISADESILDENGKIDVKKLNPVIYDSVSHAYLSLGERVGQAFSDGKKLKYRSITMSSFENLRIVDNFYQTSLYFPMPTVIISTLCEDGTTNLGPYSLVQPYYVAGKDYYAMLLCCRNSSNTAQNILRNGKCTLNFIDDKPSNFKEAVKLSWPGDKPEEKMPKCNFKLEKSLLEEETGELRPMVLTDAIQAIECTWMRELDGADKDLAGELNGYEPPYHDFNGITSKFGAHFILRVDKILMKKKYADAIINGVRAKDFPPLPVDYGYRDSKNFWFHRKTRMRTELLQMRQASLESVRYAADRADDTVKFTDEALMNILGVPRVFLSVVLKGCVSWAKENCVELITEEHMKIINDKRSKEKNKK